MTEHKLYREAEATPDTQKSPEVDAIVDEENDGAMAAIGAIRAFDHEYAEIEKIDIVDFVAARERELGRKANWWEVPNSEGVLYKLGDNHFDINFLVEADAQEFDGVDVAKVLAIASKEVLKVYSEFKRMLGTKMGVDLSYEEPYFQFEVEHGNRLTASALGGGPIGVGVGRLKSVISAYKSGDTPEFEQALAHFRSQLFHELFHMTPEVNGIDVNNTHEQITMFAEFLFDPKNNRRGNEEIFRWFGKRIGGEPAHAYHKEYQEVTAKLLLGELHKRGKVAAGLSIVEYSDILGKIDEYFVEYSLEERVQMIVDLLPCDKKSITARAEEIKEEMQLPF